MNYLLLFGLIVMNFAISWFNAWSVGHSWVETRIAGGWVRFMSWIGAVMSACGFTWVYLVVLALVCRSCGWLDQRHVEGMFALGYLVIIGPILGSGIAITIDSWAHFFRQRSFGSGALAGYNTFAQVYNTYQAIEAVPELLKVVTDVFGGKGKASNSDDDDAGKQLMTLIALLLVIAALAGGALTTAMIIRSTASAHAQVTSRRIRERKAA